MVIITINQYDIVYIYNINYYKSLQHGTHLSLRALGGGRVYKHSAILQSAVHVSHHGANIASTHGSSSILHSVYNRN